MSEVPFVSFSFSVDEKVGVGGGRRVRTTKKDVGLKRRGEGVTVLCIEDSQIVLDRCHSLLRPVNVVWLVSLVKVFSPVRVKASFFE